PAHLGMELVVRSVPSLVARAGRAPALPGGVRNRATQCRDAADDPDRRLPPMLEDETMRRVAFPFVIGAAAVASLNACNALLGNEEGTLFEPDAGTAPDAPVDAGSDAPTTALLSLYGNADFMTVLFGQASAEIPIKVTNVGRSTSGTLQFAFGG